MKKIWSICAFIGVAIIALILIILGAALLTALPSLIRQGVRQRTKLGEDSNGTLNDMTERWAHTNYSIYMNVFTVSVLNADDVIAGHKPNVTEKGPYSFREVDNRTDLDFVENGSKLYFRNKKTFFFDPNQSCANCRLTDNVTVPSLMYQKLLSILRMSNETTIMAVLEDILKKLGSEKPFLTVTVDDLLFNGYEDKLIKDMKKICGHLPKLIQKLFHCNEFPDRIGFFYGRNNTDDGLYLIYSGKEDVERIGEIIEWRNRSAVPRDVWLSPSSRMINGSDGSLYRPTLSPSDTLYIFSADICRSIYIEYDSATGCKGIPVYRFKLPRSVLDVTLAENRGFCHPLPYRFYSNHTQPDGCLPRGMLDLTTCLPGNPPVYLSLAHFLYTDQEVQDSIDGLRRPNEHTDGTFIDVEPNTGATVRASRAMQLNIGMWNADGFIRELKHMKNRIVPVLIIKQRALIDDDTRDYMMDGFVRLEKGAKLGGLLTLVLGVLLTLTLLSLCFILSIRSMRETNVNGYGEIETATDEDHLLPSGELPSHL